jgi:PAS domain S-box-containing protein
MLALDAPALFGLIDPLAGGGDLGAIMRSLDWAKTTVGPTSAWPQSLRGALSMLLATGFPMYLAWGAGFTQFYNDGFRSLLGSQKHPAAIGISTRETFAEVWDILSPMFEGAMRGTTTTHVDLLLRLDRHGFAEECYFLFSSSPIRDDSGEVGGVLVTVVETSERVIGARRRATLEALASQALEAKTAQAACEIAAGVFGEASADLPFVLVYLLDADGTTARLASAAGLAKGTPASPATVDLEGGDAPWSLGIVACTGTAQVVEVRGIDRTAASTAEDLCPSERALVVPIVQPGDAKPTGFLVAGMSARLVLDEHYRSFIKRAARHLGASIASARAFEDAQQRAKALVDLDRAKTAFFSNVSHEFRTPLTLLLGPAEEALAHADALPAADLARWELVHRNGLRLLKLVNTLLDFSRVEAGRAQASYQPTELDVLTRDLASVFRSAIEAAGLRLDLHLEPLGEPVFVDRDMWEKILFNLLSNALKFTFEGEIEVTLRRDGGRAVLRVRDTGVGVAPEELPRLFDRFHRVPGVRSRTHEGTGVGLSLMHDLVKLHGGLVSATSGVGVGTSFTVSLPLGSAHLPREWIAPDRARDFDARGAAPFLAEAAVWSVSHPVVAETEVRDAAPDRARLLLADDNVDMRVYVTRILRERWDVEAVADGATALRRAQEASFDLVLTDIMMPGHDGLELLRALRADERTRALPVIFLSARAGEEARIDGLTAGADDYLVKPFSARELTARVSTHLELSRLRLEAERARQRLYSQFMQAPVAVCVMLGPDLVFDLANPRYVAMAGRPVPLGRTLREVFPEFGPEEPIVLVHSGVVITGEPFVAEEYSVPHDRRGNGVVEEAYFKFTAQPMRDATGKVAGVMTVSLDVTEQVRARRAVEASQTLLNAVMNRIPAAVLVAEAPSGRLLLSNEQARTILGVEPIATPTLADHSAYLAVHPDGRRYAAEEHVITRALRGEVINDEEVVVIQGDGSLRTLSASGAPVHDADGRLIAAVITSSDITDRKQQEAQRRELLRREQQARAEAEVANRAKDEFLAMLGHELRNPLAPILTALELMRDAGSPSTEMVQVIERQVAHLVRLVDDLLDVARIARGGVELKRNVVELAEIVTHAVEMASPLLERREQRLTVVVARHGLPIDGDEARLSQIFSNLITNAAKYTEPGGSITIAAAREGGDVVVKVTDTGVGIAPEMLPTLFDMFVQEPQSIERSQGGLGLGLAIVRNLVTAHGGSVSAYSAGKGLGSEFTVRLPAATPKPDSTTNREPAPAPTSSSGLRILVVDDNEDVARMSSLSLRRLGHTICVAHDGPSALRAVQDFLPDVALVDIGLPVMDGYELARHLREVPGLERVRLVAVTGYGQDADRDRSLAAGFDLHLVKPVDRARYKAVLEQLAAERT